jgi:S-adenosylmethionine synthetase
VAKNVVAAGFAKRCEVQVAYAIGVAEPVSVHVNTFGTSELSDAAIEAAIRATFDLTPKGIIGALDLRKPIYSATSAYGHFGRSSEKLTYVTPQENGKKSRNVSGTAFSWERLDKVAELKRAVR